MIGSESGFNGAGQGLSCPEVSNQVGYSAICTEATGCCRYSIVILTASRGLTCTAIGPNPEVWPPVPGWEWIADRPAEAGSERRRSHARVAVCGRKIASRHCGLPFRHTWKCLRKDRPEGCRTRPERLSRCVDELFLCVEPKCCRIPARVRSPRIENGAGTVDHRPGALRALGCLGTWCLRRATGERQAGSSPGDSRRPCPATGTYPPLRTRTPQEASGESARRGSGASLYARATEPLRRRGDAGQRSESWQSSRALGGTGRARREGWRLYRGSRVVHAGGGHGRGYRLDPLRPPGDQRAVTPQPWRSGNRRSRHLRTGGGSE